MTVAETEQTSFERVHRILVAVLVVNRLPATLGYNVAYFFIGVALAWEAFQSAQYSLLVWFGVAVLLAKMQASVADAIHDRELTRSIRRTRPSAVASIDSVCGAHGGCCSWNWLEH